MRGLNYGGLHCPHKPPDNLRTEHPWVIEDQLKKRRQKRPHYNWLKDYTAENSRARTDETFREYARQAEENKRKPNFKRKNEIYTEHTGIDSETIFMRLTTLIFPWSFPPCSMHLLYENVVQIMFEHLAGRFFVTRAEVSSATAVGPTSTAARARKPKFKRRTGKNEKFLDTDDPFNIKPDNWKQIGIDTAHSNKTYPDQIGEEITNLTDDFRRMKAANWQRFLYHQSPIYFRKYLPTEHYDQWMNMVEAMRLSTRRSLDIEEVYEVCTPAEIPISCYLL